MARKEEKRMFKTIVIVLIATVVVLVGFAIVDKTTGHITASQAYNSSSVAKSGGLEVKIEGEISHAGTYLVEEGASLSTLISNAGGVSSNADPKAYDTSLELEDGWSFYIPPLYDNTNACTADPITKVCLNTATADVFSNFSFFTASVSKNIVSYREENGDFKRLEEIKNVTGIGNATWEKCKNYITLRTS